MYRPVQEAYGRCGFYAQVCCLLQRRHCWIWVTGELRLSQGHPVYSGQHSSAKLGKCGYQKSVFGEFMQDSEAEHQTRSFL